jgi:hypothetical protein
LGASKKIPEASDAFLIEAALASGMKTDLVMADCIPHLSCISNIHPQDQTTI